MTQKIFILPMISSLSIKTTDSWVFTNNEQFRSTRTTGIHYTVNAPIPILSILSQKIIYKIVRREREKQEKRQQIKTYTHELS